MDTREGTSKRVRESGSIDVGPQLGTDDTIAVTGSAAPRDGDATSDTVVANSGPPPVKQQDVDDPTLVAEDAATLAAEARRRVDRRIDDVLARGESIGRFTILRAVGCGGMGVVYAAYDPELDRKVALKLLRGDGSEAARTRLYREAQALGKLSHPNVVAVHDVGTHRGQVWVAMEFVVGQTFGAWCEEVKPSWEPIVEVIKQAARGVAAAHRAGLLHRDLKPDNIMVGRDGRVRVMDFGLARSRESQEPELIQTERRLALSVELTAVGAVMGTPAYMAAEQFAGEPADARTDQFSLCATLWEALYGERAFAGETFAELAKAVSTGARRRSPARSRVPSWVRRVVERGLEVDPAARYPDMEALLAALDADPRPRRRLLGACVGALALATAVTIGRRVEYQRAITACAAAAAEFDEVWSDAARQATRDALARTGKSYAKAAGERVIPWLDSYAAAWTETRESVCLAATVEGRWDDSDPANDGVAAGAPGEMRERAEACLEEGRDQFESLVAQLSDSSTVTENAISGSVRAASILPAPGLCENEARLSLRPIPPSAEEARRTVRALRKLLARSATLELIGDYKEGLALATEAQRGADALGWGPLRAAATLSRSLHHDKLGEYEVARDVAEEALLLAAAAGVEDVYADAAGHLAWVMGLRLANFDAGLFWGEMEGVLLERAGIPKSDIRWGRRFNNMGVIYFEMRSLEQAQRHHEAALEIRMGALGPEHPDVASSLNNIGVIHGAAGELEEAEDYFTRALRIREKALGPEHPDVAAALNNLGRTYKLQGKYERAEEYMERSLRIRENTLGENHPSLINSLTNLGEGYKSRGALGAATERFERAWRIALAAHGEDHPKVGQALYALATTLLLEGAYAEAKVRLEEAVKIQEKALGEEHPDLADALVALATVHLNQGSYAEALAHGERALRIHEAALGAEHLTVAKDLSTLGEIHSAQGSFAQARGYFERSAAILRGLDEGEHPELALVLAGLGDVLVALGENDEARAVLERALAIGERSESEPAKIAAIRFRYAKALWADGERRDRSREQAERALESLAAAGEQAAEERAAIEAWLRRHSP